jgi:siderophore synthetase component
VPASRAPAASPPSDRTEAGAAAAILARLWGALAREPIPGVAHRTVDGPALAVRLGDGTVLTGDASVAAPFAQPGAGFSVAVTAPGAAAPRDVTAPGELVRAIAPALGRHAGRLADELENSVSNLALARAARPDPDGGPPMLDRAATEPDPLAYVEQSVVDGHPLHPCARTRLGLAPDQVRTYAPEHRPTVALRAVAVPEDRWYGVNCPPTLLLHPCQHERLREQHPWLDRVDHECPARPLMSLRTLAFVNDRRHHIKTAVDVQMTSAVRTVSAASIHNGAVLSRLLLDLRHRVPGLDAMVEPRGGAAVVDGAPDRRLAMVHRFTPGVMPGDLVFPLAALAAPSPASGAPLATEIVDHGYGLDPLAFVEALAGLLLRAVFGCLGLGLALEAHGQNVLGTLRGGRLVRLVYRDYGGVRVSARRLHEHGIEPPPLHGEVQSDDPEVVRTKVIASAVSTVLGEVIAVLARHAGLDETVAWHRVARVARTLPGPDALHLFDDTLPLKAMTAMRLADNPTRDIWCRVPNPMAGLR